MRLPFLLVFLIILSCKTKRDFRIPNNYYPDYKLGDTLVFGSESGKIAKYLCTKADHKVTIEENSEHIYHKEQILIEFYNIEKRSILNEYISIDNNGLFVSFPYSNSGFTDFGLLWNKFSTSSVFSDTINFIPYHNIISLNNSNISNYRNMEYDLYKGIMLYKDSSNALWVLREHIRP